MQIAPSGIERFYLRYEFAAEHMLSSSDCESRTVRELLELEPEALDRLLELRCGYTESPGAPSLRKAIAATYSEPSANATPAGWSNFSATIRTVRFPPRSVTS